MSQYSGEIDEDMFLRIKEEFTRKIRQNDREIKAAEEKLSVCSNSATPQGAYDIVKKHTTFTELTNEMAIDFIDYVEIGEKNKAGGQEIIIHWNF